MTIGIYTKKGSYSVSGNSVEDHVISVAYNESMWDILAEAPGFSQSIHLSPEAVKRVVSAGVHLSLMERMETPDGTRSMVFPMTSAGEALRRMIEGCLQRAERAELAGYDLAQVQWATDDLTASAACLIDELIETDSFLSPSGRTKRYSVALEIERMLWKNPMDESVPSSTDEFAAHFDCSRRRIQQIVEEHFGIGFVALKRFIRLQQVYEALSSPNFDGKISTLAYDYEFENLGRFSGYFKDMFGIKPSTLRRKVADDDTQ